MICIKVLETKISKKNQHERYVELLIVMLLQVIFELILT